MSGRVLDKEFTQRISELSKAKGLIVKWMLGSKCIHERRRESSIHPCRFHANVCLWIERRGFHHSFDMFIHEGGMSKRRRRSSISPCLIILYTPIEGGTDGEREKEAIYDSWIDDVNAFHEWLHLIRVSDNPSCPRTIRACVV